MRIYAMSVVLAAFGVLGLAAPAGATTSCLKNPIACANAAVCDAAAVAGLQCVDR